jgi:hypothetical protein
VTKHFSKLHVYRCNKERPDKHGTHSHKLKPAHIYVAARLPTTASALHHSVSQIPTLSGISCVTADVINFYTKTDDAPAVLCSLPRLKDSLYGVYRCESKTDISNFLNAIQSYSTRNWRYILHEKVSVGWIRNTLHEKLYFDYTFRRSVIKQV